MPSAAIAKLYYSIGEVSSTTGIDQHVLRYWETEFRELSPRKNRGGKRLYRDTDLRLILQIKELLYNQRYTIEGARRWLKENPRELWERGQTSLNAIAEQSNIISSIREGLHELKQLLNA
ncbi:MAG: MerR family transcriptional regulator [Calditrichaeota bacterium]|nr:MerR family transcriptional regulator [Calditrichota bacterium]